MLYWCVVCILLLWCYVSSTQFQQKFHHNHFKFQQKFLSMHLPRFNGDPQIFTSICLFVTSSQLITVPILVFPLVAVEQATCLTLTRKSRTAVTVNWPWLVPKSECVWMVASGQGQSRNATVSLLIGTLKLQNNVPCMFSKIRDFAFEMWLFRIMHL